MQSDADIEEALFGNCYSGRSVSDYFVVGDLILSWQTAGPHAGEPMALLIESDDLAAACREYLRRHGVKEFESIEDAETARDQA